MDCRTYSTSKQLCAQHAVFRIRGRDEISSRVPGMRDATLLPFCDIPQGDGADAWHDPLSENHMMRFYAEHASGEATHHRMLLEWMIRHGIVNDFREVSDVITTPETNACVNLAYQMAIEQDRDKWLVALNCGIERCSNDFFKVVAANMHQLGVGDPYFDVHVEADEHHSIMGLEYISKDMSDLRKSVLIAKSLEGISLWAAMLHSWIGMTAFPVFNEYGDLARRRQFVLS